MAVVFFELAGRLGAEAVFDVVVVVAVTDVDPPVVPRSMTRWCRSNATGKVGPPAAGREEQWDGDQRGREWRSARRPHVTNPRRR